MEGPLGGCLVLLPDLGGLPSSPPAFAWSRRHLVSRTKDFRTCPDGPEHCTGRLLVPHLLPPPAPPRTCPSMGAAKWLCDPQGHGQLAPEPPDATGNGRRRPSPCSQPPVSVGSCGQRQQEVAGEEGLGDRQRPLPSCGYGAEDTGRGPGVGDRQAGEGGEHWAMPRAWPVPQHPGPLAPTWVSRWQGVQ